MATGNNANLALSNIIQVSVTAPGALLSEPNMSNLAFLTTATTPAGWAAGQVYGLYNSPQAVAADFGSTSDMANMATAVFSQSPNILSGGGSLIIVPRLQSPSLESVEACLIRIAGTISFAGFCVDVSFDNTVSTFLNLATYCQANSLIFFYTSANIANLQPGSLLDQARTASDTFTRCMYYGGTLPNSQTQVFSASYAGRGMSVNFDGANTFLSMNLQTLAGIQPDQTINQTAYAAAQAAGVDIYVSVSGIPCVITSGTNLYFDQVFGRAWLAFSLQVAGFNYLKSAAAVPGKIPQTEVGMTGLRDAYTQTLQQGLVVGYLAPGDWQLPFSFGNPIAFQSNIESLGYYIVSQPIASQTVTQLQSRVAPLVQIAAQESGALQSSSVLVEIQP